MGVNKQAPFVPIIRTKSPKSTKVLSGLQSCSLPRERVAASWTTLILQPADATFPDKPSQYIVDQQLFVQLYSKYVV